MIRMDNSLQHLEEFKKILADYHISNQSKTILARTKLALLLAPSGGGRNTLIRELVKTGKYHFIVSDTTRKPRVNDGIAEKNGVEYWFRTEQEILADLEAGKFLEAELIHGQQVSGISIRELQKAQDENRIAITDVDMGGLHNIVQAVPDITAVLVLPPSFEEWQRRMLNRGEMTVSEHKRRLETAIKIFSMALEHSYFKFVINDKLEHAVEQIQALTHKQVNTDQQQKDRVLTKRLITDTQNWLKTN